MKRGAPPATSEQFDFSSHFSTSNNKIQKTIDNDIVHQFLSSLRELKSIQLFQTIFQKIHKDPDVITDEFAYHSWETDLHRAFDYCLDTECEESEELEDELNHVYYFAVISTQKLKEYLMNRPSRLIIVDGAKAEQQKATTENSAVAEQNKQAIKRHEKEANAAIRIYASETVIPTVLQYIKSVKLSPSEDAQQSNVHRLIIPRSVKSLSHLDHSLTDRIRDMFLNVEPKQQQKQHDNDQATTAATTLSLTVYASPHLDKQTIVPVFHTIHNLLRNGDDENDKNREDGDGDEQKLVVSELKIERDESVLSDEVFHSLGDGSCVALVNDGQDLLIMHDNSLYRYTKQQQQQHQLTPLTIDTTSNSIYPRYSTSDLVPRGDGQNFVVMAASDETGATCDLWNLHYPSLTWTLLDKSNIEMPVPDAITMLDNCLYVIVPSSTEETESTFNKYDMEKAEWSSVKVDGFFPLMERVRIQALDGHLLAFGDFESSTLLFAFNVSTGQWRAVDVDPVIRSEENLFDTLICKGMKDGHVILYYEYSDKETNSGYLQYVNLQGCL